MLAAAEATEQDHEVSECQEVSDQLWTPRGRRLPAWGCMAACQDDWQVLQLIQQSTPPISAQASGLLSLSELLLYLDGVHDDSEGGNCKLVGVPQVMVI